MNQPRCNWVSDDPLYQSYHDHEWAVPCNNDQQLFEMICLEGAQAGLSWITVLKRRQHYRQAFANFDAEKVAGFSAKKIDKLMQNEGLIRHRGKLESVVKNAQAFLAIQNQHSFSDFIWQFVDGQTQHNPWPDNASTPASTETSTELSKTLKKKGFSFVGPTICYAFMQAAGLVNDHQQHCFRQSQLMR